MFIKREPNLDNFKIQTGNGQSESHERDIFEPGPKRKVNTIVKGSRFRGDISIAHDLELEGEVEGNITSEEDSNIIIKGKCKGSIRTEGGNVDIEGEMSEGDIFAGGNVRITGTFNGGKIEAKGKIYVGGEFNGKLESNEIEIGQKARGKGEIFYREFISVVKGAGIEANIMVIPEEKKEVKKTFKAADNRSTGKKESYADPVQQLLLHSH